MGFCRMDMTMLRGNGGVGNSKNREYYMVRKIDGKCRHI